MQTTSALSSFRRRALAVAILGSCAVLVADLVRALLGHHVDWLQVAPALLIILISAVVLQQARRPSRRVP
jgi:CHASE2 domain-containing sensor protein